MNVPSIAPPNPGRRNSEIRAALVAAALMLGVPYAAKIAGRNGWADTGDFAERSLMVILAGFIVFTGNSIPKRLIPRECFAADPAGVRWFMRLAGWTWVLAGLELGLACAFLPRWMATTATFVLMPAAIAIIAVAWMRLKR